MVTTKTETTCGPTYSLARGNHEQSASSVATTKTETTPGRTSQARPNQAIYRMVASCHAYTGIVLGQ